MDVFETEPLPRDNMLWDTPGIWVTGHTAAPSFVGPVAELFKHNLGRYLAGRTPDHVVIKPASRRAMVSRR